MLCIRRNWYERQVWNEMLLLCVKKVKTNPVGIYMYQYYLLGYSNGHPESHPGRSISFKKTRKMLILIFEFRRKIWSCYMCMYGSCYVP